MSKNIKKLTPSYELCFEMKQLGFRENCIYHYKRKSDGSSHSSVTSFEMTRPFGHDHNQFDTRVSAPLWEDVFNWFETKGLFVDRRVTCSVNEILSIDYTIKSIHGTWDVEFDEPYDEYDRNKSNIRILKTLINILK